MTFDWNSPLGCEKNDRSLRNALDIGYMDTCEYSFPHHSNRFPRSWNDIPIKPHAVHSPCDMHRQTRETNRMTTTTSATTSTTIKSVADMVRCNWSDRWGGKKEGRKRRNARFGDIIELIIQIDWWIDPFDDRSIRSSPSNVVGVVARLIFRHVVHHHLCKQAIHIRRGKWHR